MKDLVIKCGVDVGTSACVYASFNVELAQKIIIAICIVFVNVFFYPVFTSILKWLNKKLNLGVKEQDIEKASKDAEEKIKEAIKSHKKDGEE